LLPPDIARRYQAIPIATDGERITVAMADPNNPTARKAVVDSLGPETCLVQAKPQEIEGLLNESRLPSISSKLHFMCWSPTESISTKVESFAQAFAQILEARLTSRTNSDIGQRPQDVLATDIQSLQPDLVIFQSPATLFSIWKMPTQVEDQPVKRIPESLLLVRKPHRLIKNILLVLRDFNFDAFAIQWAIRIASKSGAAITLLPAITPTLPIVDGITLEQRSKIHFPRSACSLGEILRQVSQYLARQKIQGVLHLREGTLIDQIRQEIKECEHDFIVIAADVECSTVPWLMSEQFNQLLSLSEIPILIAKPVKRGHL